MPRTVPQDPLMDHEILYLGIPKGRWDSVTCHCYPLPQTVSGHQSHISSSYTDMLLIYGQP